MVTAVWGWTFVLVKDAVTHYPTLPFLQIRFAIALLVMAVVVRRLPTRRELQVGVVIGAVLAAGYLTQTAGLTITSPGNTKMIAESVPAAEAIVWTILFSWMVESLNERSTAMEITAAGIEVATVRPILSPA